MENSNTDCGQPICCRSECGEGKEGNRAHILGDWNCDLSPALFSSMVDAIDSLPVRPDFILNTGDDPAHDVWNQNHESNLKAIEYVSKEFLSGIGRRIPVVNTLGNHEHAPVNQYKGPGEDAWLYENASAFWSTWLSNDAKRTMSYGGYYATRVAPGLRAVVMHSTMFNSGVGANWAFMTNQTDIGAQFPWLVNVLDQAREREEKVLLLRHCPIEDFDMGYDELMRNITVEYNDVIVSSFAGHAHTTFYRTLHNDKGEAVSNVWVSGSGTPGGGNPTFRVFRYDLKTFELLDYDQYWVDLNLAIKTGNATWRKDHSALEYYSLPDMSASSWDALARSWLNGDDNMTTWRHYARAFTRDHRPIESVNRVHEACSALTVTSSQYKDCKDGVQLMSSSLSSTNRRICTTNAIGYRVCSEEGRDDQSSGLWMLNMFIDLAKKIF